MKIVRFISGGGVHFGNWVEQSFALELTGESVTALRATDRKLRIEKLLAPFVPTDILCIGLNYRDHAAESKSEIPKNPMLFIKAANTLNNPGDPIPMPKLSSQIDYEGELAIVISKPAKHVSRERALDYVLGYTIANDVTARDWQRDKSLGGGQFARGKSFDGFCPIGPCILTADQVPDPNALHLRTTLNGQLMQDNSTADMIFDVRTLIESLSSTMTLRAGSIILTGTPKGVGMGRTPPVWMKSGDRIVVEIDPIGRLENPVTAEACRF